VDFERVLRTITDHLHSNGRRFALVGGHALAAYGLVRATVDLDLVVETEAQSELIAFLERLGYETLHRSTGYSNHLHSDPTLGRADFVYVRGETASKLFEQTTLLAGPGGLEVPVPKPEHLAAMKVQAMKNDPGRTLQELSDLQFLVRLDGVNRAEVRSYFERHGLLDRFEELE
jgi:hypothetical protein